MIRKLHKSFWTKVGDAFKSESLAGNAALMDLKSFNVKINSFSNDVNVFGQNLYRFIFRPSTMPGDVPFNPYGECIPGSGMVEDSICIDDIFLPCE